MQREQSSGPDVFILLTDDPGAHEGWDPRHFLTLDRLPDFIRSQLGSAERYGGSISFGLFVLVPNKPVTLEGRDSDDILEIDPEEGISLESFEGEYVTPDNLRPILNQILEIANRKAELADNV
jgi:hypothetical protein